MSTAGDTTRLPAFVHTPISYDHAATHVFFPVELPKKNDCTPENDFSLIQAVCAAAHAYSAHVEATPQWHRTTKMLDNLSASTRSEQLDKGHVISQLRGMRTGDIIVFFIRPQNAAVVLTKQENYMIFESFEVSPSSDTVRKVAGSLICSYPWSAVEVLNEVFDDEHFQSEFANFLSRPHAVDLDLPPPPPGDPHYIVALLTGILRGVGRTADVPRITKHIRDHVGRWPFEFGTVEKGDWRRSSLWLLVRATIQMSADRSPLGRASYKRFMLFFICTLARDPNNTNLSSNLLHLMSSKIFRRLSKLGSSTPDGLSELALDTRTCLREILDARWKLLGVRPSPFRNPSQDELRRDTRLSLLDSREYIQNALANHGHEPLRTPFQPSHHRRGTIDDFLSSNGSFYDEAYRADPSITLYDVERSVEQGIDDWIACVTNVEEACTQLETLMDKYMMNAFHWYDSSLLSSFSRRARDCSVVLLTGIELFVALDKLVVKENPMLADYSPEIPISFLEGLLLHKTTGLHRLARAYQYISARHSRSRLGWSVLSNEFTEDSFAVRYYDRSARLQQLKARIEEDAMAARRDGAQLPPAASVVHDYDGCQECHQHLAGRWLPTSTEVSRSPLPALPLHAKVVVFELHCPTCVCIWRSAVSRILVYFYDDSRLCGTKGEDENNLLAHVPALQRYFVPHKVPSLHIQIHFAYFYPASRSRNSPILRYALCNQINRSTFQVWQPKDWDVPLLELGHKFGRTSNGVLATQAYCPANLSLDEFITLGHLKGSGSLQWLNILCGLRSRTLNLRHDDIYSLFACTAYQVGPLDTNTGAWVWHTELQDSSFCNALLDELDSSFVVSSIDGTLMSTISLLLSRVLASSPSECVSKRAIALLQSVRRKTFSWVQELSYNLVKAPTNEERSNLLWDMAATCRSTFDVDRATLRKLFHSAEDVDALVSCTLLVYTLRLVFRVGTNSDGRLGHALEGILSDVILADPSDYGVDLAVGKVFVIHRPGVHRWERLQDPNARWLTCKTKDQPSQTVHVNLLNGELRVDGRPLSGLPDVVGDSREYQRIFHDQGFFVIPSDLPGMDFTTLGTTSQHKVHFSLRGLSLLVRAQCDQTNEIFELIPPEKLQHDLPEELVDDHVHWLNLSKKSIEIQPLDRLWDQSSENWRIDCTPGQYRMYKGHETLVDIRSPTWAMVSKCFECLTGSQENPESRPPDLLITTSPVDLPRYVRLSVMLPFNGLSFFVNEQGEIESEDFKDMIYDENQCIGTLFGLENLLVLRQKTQLPGDLIPRRILVPGGFPEKHGDYQVRVNTRCYLPLSYIVDIELGCLIGDGSLESTRYLAYLHAMTSCHRPDPLTGKTGAEAALSLLQSAGCRSVAKLKALDEGYRWASTQYPHINAAHEGIQHRYYWRHVVHKCKANTAQEKRAARRAAHLLPSNAIGPSSPEDCDDMVHFITDSDSELENVAFAAACVVRRWSMHAPTMDTILNWAKLWSDNDTPALPLSQDEVRWNLNLVQTLIAKVCDILESREGTCRHQLLFLLPTVAYCSPSRQAAFLSMLIAFTTQPQSHSGDRPIHADCKIVDGYRPTKEVVRYRIHRSRFEGWHYDEADSDSEDAIVERLLKDWPSDTPPTVSLGSNRWHVATLTAGLQQLFSSCYRNFNLKEHVMRAITGPEAHTLPHPASSPQYIFDRHTPSRITLDQLLSNRPAPELPPRTPLLCDRHRDDKTSSNDVPTLDQLISSLRTDASVQREYITHLVASTQHLRGESRMTCTVVGVNRIETLEKHYAQCRINYMGGLAALKQSLGPTSDPHEQTLEQFGQWPPITADVLLRCLASTSTINLPGQWKKCLVSLALLLLDLQRSRRLLRFTLDRLEEEFSKELENEVCEGWNPEKYPDWLLVQIQGNFTIRPTQAETAMKMISPTSGGNTVMQVNMGEGKSSVITPIAAAALADGERLVRVIVPKALTVQMFELLVSRLGGLVNRPIYHLPFSRSPEYNEYGRLIGLQIDDLHRLMSQCKAERGILLVQPEHVMSLKLMSVEEQTRKCRPTDDLLPKLQKYIFKHILSLKSLPDDSFVGNVFRWLSQLPDNSSNRVLADHHDDHSDHGASNGASKWLSLQKWIHSHTRDILDESDEILHSRFQLIYTIGIPQHMDGYPDRWMITQHVLRLVKKHAASLSRCAPDSIEYERGPSGSFPHVRITRTSDVGRDLILLIVKDVMDGRLPAFNFQHLDAGGALDRAIRSFISDENVFQVPGTVKMVEEYAKLSHQSHLWGGLLLLRGLLASNILLFSLAEWRWRVNYGLVSQLPHKQSHYDPIPTMLAVPYRAKDVPAPNTQFGHPDITIILTCLSYYYAGLSEEQLRLAFEILLDQDDSSTEYALWMNEHDHTSGPESELLQELGEMNLKSSEQWDKVIFPHFSRNQGAIDFYLSRVVFPKEAKEFPWKITGSGWDLAERRENVITGFSGTNDGHWLLPTSITQHNLDNQKATNARVLACLLQPKNDSYMVAHENGERWTTLKLLQMVVEQKPTIRVLLDVGAQILDFANCKVAKAWLDIAPDTAGAIYFNRDDELMVLTRNGYPQSMGSSPLAQQLDRCVVYLDHVHTRGTDIKFPIGSRAAVTLGPKVTKDSLVQGCMRMRKLGHGHSVMFFAPLEVDQHIRGVAGIKDASTRVTTVEILSWAIHETWADIRQRVPYWAQQGMSHKSRSQAWSRFCNNEIGPDQLSDTWLQPERKSLANLYAPCKTKSDPSTLSELDPVIHQRCKDLGALPFHNAQMEEEQEREVNREREREREAELPPIAEPAEHFLHPDVVAFVKTGVVSPSHSGSAFRPVFTTLEKSSAATREADVWSPYILATADFCNTIKPESTRGTMDQYLRPVQWVLSRKNYQDRDPLLVLLSPFEADRLMPDIRASEHVHLHLYAPRTSQRMRPSDDLKLYSIPPLPSDWTPPWALIDQLNVFAGQLYLRDHRSFRRLCHFLDVSMEDVPNESDTAVRRNLFNIPGSFEENEVRFSGSPLPFVMALLAIRSRGRPFAQTHMGKILQGQLLTENDFDRPTLAVSGHCPGPTTCDRQTLHDATPESMPSSPSDMECDVQEDPVPSVLPRSSKRGLEMAELPNADLQPPQKRLRTD